MRNGCEGTINKLGLLLLFIITLAPPIWAQSMWQLTQTSDGWNWTAPGGGGFCKYAGVSLLDNSALTQTTEFPTVVPAKYPSWNAWAQAQSDRVKSMGFNSAGQYSYRYMASMPSGGIPAIQVFQTGWHMTRDDYPYHIKNLDHGFTGEVCGSTFYRPSTGGMPDPFEPDTPAAFVAAVAEIDGQCGVGSRCINSANPFVMVEEGDTMFEVNSVLTHADFGVIATNANPVQTTSVDGGYTYPDKAVYTKFAERDFLANEYGCSGSADPAAGNYCGSGPAASALAALNAAWFGSTVYTTWNTSCSGGITSIHNGSYSCYGTGTGFLDENGTHTLSSATKTSCRVYPNDPWPASAAIKTDTHAFATYFAAEYAQEEAAAWAQPAMQPHPPIVMPNYDGPSYTYTAMAPYYDAFYINPNAYETGGQQGRVAMTQRVIAASSVPGGKSMPIIWADYSAANPDSFYHTSQDCNPCYNLRQDEGNGMVSDWQQILPLQDVNGKYVITGIEHWAYYDSPGEQWSSGLVTTFGDNLYDGSASIATATHSNTWQSRHTYPAPSLIWDGADYEALSGNITTSCVSGSGTPSWASKMGAATTDGSCLWRNEGPYTLKPEQASRIFSTATIPGQAYGDMITPLASFLNAGICDPGGSGVVITTGSLPGGTVSDAYSQTLAASGGTGPYSWSLTGGSLPNGLTLSSGGVISGTPTNTGTFGFTVRATDTLGASGTKALSITITQLTITTTSLPPGTKGLPYSTTLMATGGQGANTWSIVGGGIPPGLALNGSTGVISGTPTTAGVYAFTVRVADSESATANALFSIPISGVGHIH
jgi:Putative Ig domain